MGLGAPVNYSAAADASCYDCARATLGRVVFYFYLLPSQAGAQGGGLPASVAAPQTGAVLPAGGGIPTERMSAVVWPLQGQRTASGTADAHILGGHGLRWHATLRRACLSKGSTWSPGLARPPLQVVPSR